MKQAQVEMYFSPYCGYCVMAKQLLQAKGVSYTAINVIEQPEKRDEMLARANGRTTVPQIFIQQQAVGGYTDLAALEHSGELDTLLFPNTSE